MLVLGPFICEVCGRDYKYKSNMTFHMKRCGQKIFACGKCKKRFTTKYALKRHIDNGICTECVFPVKFE